MFKSRPAQAFFVIALFFVTYWLLFTGSGEEFSPEELNSLLQNKNADVVELKKTELMHQKLVKPFVEQESDFKLKHWDITGNTLLHKGSHIRLVLDNQHQVGNMFSKLPIQAESFEMELTFRIKGKEHAKFYGDGFAIWFIDERSPIGDVFGARNNFNGLGVFLDTYRNGKRGKFPFVNLMLGDGKTPYNKETDGFETRLAGCTANSELINPHNGETKMRLVYIKNGYLSIDFNYNGIHEDWKNCVTLTDVKLPSIKYFGLTAETGELSHSVDVLENRMYALYKPDGEFVGSVEELEELINGKAKELEEPEPEKPSGGSKRHRALRKKRAELKRKSLLRLKKSEARIKERERKLRLEKYGSEDATFFNRWMSRLWKVVKLVSLVGVIVVVAWFAWIVIRVQKQKKRKSTGLLD